MLFKFSYKYIDQCPEGSAGGVDRNIECPAGTAGDEVLVDLVSCGIDGPDQPGGEPGFIGTQIFRIYRKAKSEHGIFKEMCALSDEYGHKVFVGPCQGDEPSDQYAAFRIGHACRHMRMDEYQQHECDRHRNMKLQLLFFRIQIVSVFLPGFARLFFICRQ